MIINDKIWGPIEIENKYESIINSKEIQDLKSKRQLGMTPTETSPHTRFDHSIGVYHLACQLINVIKEKLNAYLTITKEEEDAIKIMALVHDIGHGPFSHLAERLLNDSHENNTIRLLKGNTNIHNTILKNFNEETLNKIIYLIELKEKVRNKTIENSQLDIMFIISKLLSGGIDIDRLDYIARDTYYVLGKKEDFSDILKCINIDYINDYIELTFDDKAQYLIANFLNKRYEMYDTVYLNVEKFLIECYLDKLLKKINYPISWNSQEEDILKYLKDNLEKFSYIEKRWTEILLNNKLDNDIKYIVFNNKNEYELFLDELYQKFKNIYGVGESLILTHNKLSIHTPNNKIYINKNGIVSEIQECQILNSSLQREKYIVGFDFKIFRYFNSDEKLLEKIDKQFKSDIEVEKKYQYIGPDTNELEKTITDALKLENPEITVNNDYYYDINNQLYEKRMTLRNRITKAKNIWNIKEPADDKSSITKRHEKSFVDLNGAANYLKKVYKIDIEKLELLYNSITNRKQYKFKYLNSEFEIAFDETNVNDYKFNMIEIELKKGNAIDMYYLNNLMKSFQFLDNCQNSKNELITTHIKKKCPIKS